VYVFSILIYSILIYNQLYFLTGEGMHDSKHPTLEFEFTQNEILQKTEGRRRIEGMQAQGHYIWPFNHPDRRELAGY